MSSPDPSPLDPTPSQGISLEQLTQAFAEAMGGSVFSPNAEEDGTNAVVGASSEQADRSAASSETSSAPDAEADFDVDATVESDACPIEPRTIFEAMLFVGNEDNRPLSAEKAAELMRDVSPDEIPALVDELNAFYQSENAPYRVIKEGDGFRLVLREEFAHIGQRFYGRIQEARLSQAAIDVLAVVAYKQPIGGEQIGKLRGKPSSHLLSQLARRGLIRIDREASTPRNPQFRTTDRFLKVFNLESLGDLPLGEDPP